MKIINIIRILSKKLYSQARLVYKLFYPFHDQYDVHHDGVVCYSSSSLRDAYDALQKRIPSRYLFLLHDYHHVAAALQASGDYHIVLPTGTPMGIQGFD